MSPEQQRIAIAKACGWTDVEGGSGIHPAYKGRHTYVTDLSTIPHYLSDLNAMHEAEKVLEPEKINGKWWDYVDNLDEICGQYAIRATAAQRAEAFLRTLNL